MREELLAPIGQTLWGRLAVANFFLGGAGAGAYVVAAVAAGLAPGPLLRLASYAGALLVAAGFLSVAVEAGRPLRGARVLRKAGSSWMSRESWLGGLFVGLVGLALLWPWAGWRAGAVLAALGVALAQGEVLRHCRGVAAWSVGMLPAVFVASSLASGAGVLALAGAILPGEVAPLVPATGGLVLLSGLAWAAYLAWPAGAAFREASAPLRGEPALLGVFVVGHLLPLALLGLAAVAVPFAPAVTAAAGAAVLAGQLQAKAWLILRAGALRPITLELHRRLT
jgi:phenylacetyl-CoA:acceptor oxidoreductase subunit 2